MSEKINLKSVTLSGIKWNTIGQLGYQGVSLFVSIILARVLSPAEFGLIAMLFIFSEIANAFINSGLSAALIQKKQVTSIDCSTIFYFNIILSFSFYILLFLLAPFIAHFYNEPQLIKLIKYYNLAFLIHSFSLIQATLLIKELNYKVQNIIQLLGVIISGVVAVMLAYNGAGVYSLIGQSLTFAFVTGILYWYHSKWNPTFNFSTNSFKEMYSFGLKVFLVSLLDKIFNAIDNLLVGKIFNAEHLGLYNRAKTTKDIPINNVTNIITSITFPVFSKIDSIHELRKIHNQYLSLVSYIIFPILVGLGITAESFIKVVFSEKWLPSVPYLQIFCLFAATIPFNSIMVNTILSRGKSGKFLKLELIKKTIILISMATGIIWGLKTFLFAMCLSYYIAFFITAIYIAKLLEENLSIIIKAFIPSLSISIIMGVLVYLMSIMAWNNSVIQLIMETLAGVFIYLLLSIIFKNKELTYLYQLLKTRYSFLQ